MLMAGLGWYREQDQSGRAGGKDLYDLEAKEAAKIRTMPGKPGRGAEPPREGPSAFLLKAGVFSEDLIEAWIGYQADQGSR